MCAQEDDESEEGEVAEPSRQADEDYDSADEYDEEGYKGEEDRQKLFAMSVLDREQILADRFDRKERRRETLQVRRRTARASLGPRRRAARELSRYATGPLPRGC